MTFKTLESFRYNAVLPLLIVAVMVVCPSGKCCDVMEGFKDIEQTTCRSLSSGTGINTISETVVLLSSDV